MFPLLVLALISLFPQGDTGQLSGRVIDANGAVVPAASIKLISQPTSQLRKFARSQPEAQTSSHSLSYHPAPTSLK